MGNLIRRLQSIDRFLVLVVVPLWIASLVLHVQQWMNVGSAEPAILIAAPVSATECPLVRVTRLRSHPATDGAAPVPGDRLLRVGAHDLTGLGPVGFFVRAMDALGPGDRAPLVFEHDGVRQEGVLEFDSMPLPIRFVLVSCG